MELTNEQLIELKQKELEILKEFISACQQLNLKYYLVYGTLIGAVRHGGFIPWDDDIDVAMMREDYEIFRQKRKDILPESLFVQNHVTDPAYPHLFMKLRNSNTTFIETAGKNMNINHGVFIDIFPLDFVSQKQPSLVEKLFIKICNERLFHELYLPEAAHPMKYYILKPLFKILFPKTSTLISRYEKIIINKENSDRVLNSESYPSEAGGHPVEWFGEGKILKFEGVEVTVPSEYEKYLTKVYGNYMQLPPEEERVPHHFVESFDMQHSYKTRKVE